ncbi:Ras GTPase-activating protein 1 [Chionoecetes opilio]|uniref:Ras GTPase-activating protein 1 n=1 Tax=Chionoecetes opilio TaxID=41210 RepID=A0A8J5CQU5_CHIOP|nr:Ras GTPase-activating protein 1 [Chionoecetes opilio]
MAAEVVSGAGVSSGARNVSVRPKDKLHGSPSTGSDEGQEVGLGDDFDPFHDDPDEPDEVDSSLSAPPEESWYHGRLDRAQSEERLRQFGKLGSYLVRESDRRPGSYVLSYLGRSGVSHFKITAVCGDFYIGGRQFNALSDLVGYYTGVSDLLKRERLVHPVPPPEPVNDLRKVVAILPYTKMADTDELSFQKGDIFFVHNELSDGWLWVTAHRTGEQGTIFADLVETLDDDIDPNIVFSWFHPDITKNDAIDLLIKGQGSFLVRPSDNSPGDYTLFFLTNNIIQRFRIEKRGVKYLMGGRTFSCLDAVIHRYKTEQILEGHTLGGPVCKVVSGERLGLPIVPVKEVEQPEKIYATLNEIREKLGVTKFKGIQKQGWLYKKSKKNKKWKCLYFVLTDILYYYDNPKRTKPRGLIDLNCSYLYQVHDTFFERPNCFQLVERELPCLSTVTYLCSESQELTNDWMAVLRPLCVPQTAGQPKLQTLKFMKSLHLTIMQAMRLPSKIVPSPYCLVSLNQVKVCRTRPKPGPDPVWDEEFSLDDIPSDVIMFTITVYNHGKRSKDSEIAEVRLELNTLQNGEEVEDWYSLTGITPVGDWGAVRLRYRSVHSITPVGDWGAVRLRYRSVHSITPVGDWGAVRLRYRSVHRHHTRGRLGAVRLRYRSVHRHHTRGRLGRRQTQIQVSTQASHPWETGAPSDSDTGQYTGITPVGDWGAVRLRYRYFHDLIMPCEEYNSLKELLLDPSLEAVQALADVSHRDRNPLATSLLRIFRNECREHDLLQRLTEHEIEREHETSTLFRAASLTTTLLDLYMKATCTYFLTEAISETIHRILETKQSCELNPNKMDNPMDACANAEFLLRCRDPLNSRHALPKPPHPTASRSLIMIAKCLQNLANLVEFGGKEPYMEVVNPFILKNKERMISYLDQLSNVRERPEIEDAPVKSEPSRDLAQLHHICVTHLTHLTNRAKTQVTLKKLVTVTDMLRKHKEKYQEMMR